MALRTMMNYMTTLVYIVGWKCLKTLRTKVISFFFLFFQKNPHTTKKKRLKQYNHNFGVISVTFNCHFVLTLVAEFILIGKKQIGEKLYEIYFEELFPDINENCVKLIQIAIEAPY